MRCQHPSALPHCAAAMALRLATVACVAKGLHPGQGHVRQRSRGHHCCQTVPSSLHFFSLSLNSPFMQRSQLLQKSFSQKPRKLAFCHNSGENWTESTSMQTLSSSICGLNRGISRKGLKVITLDKKGIYYGPRAADTSTLSDFRGPWSLRWDRNFETLYMSISLF